MQFVVTITASDGYVYARRVTAEQLDRFVEECEQTVNPRYEGITVMAAHLYSEV